MKTTVVIDNSVVMRWFHPMGSAADISYADTVLDAMGAGTLSPVAPVIFLMEFPDVLHELDRRGELQGSIESALIHWDNLAFNIMGFEKSASLYMHELSALSRDHRLTAYDAAYLELALRESCPLLTLDKALIKASKKAGIQTQL